MYKKLLLILLILSLTACITDQPETPPTVLIITTTPDRVATLVHSPTLPPLNVSMQTLPPEENLDVPAPPLPPKPCTDNIVPDTTTQYILNADLNWETKSVAAQQRVTFTNTTGAVQDNLVFQVEANREPKVAGTQFILNGIYTSDNRKIENVSINHNRMTVPLPDGLGVDCTVTLDMTFNIQLPAITEGYATGRTGYFGYSDKQINLGHWMPMVALYGIREDWYTPDIAYVGEITTAESSDFDLTIRLLQAPESAVIVGPGKSERSLGSNEWHFELPNARDLTVSAVYGITIEPALMENINGDKIAVEVYYFPEYAPTNISAKDTAIFTLQAAKNALIFYEELFDVAYPYEKLVIMQGDFPDGMEFSGIVFVSSDWFTSWRGEVNSWLTLITVHEVAHQWWYSLLGNDPSIYPYLDEAFATYSEYLYMEHYHPEFADWWWRFRVDPHELGGPVDANVYRYADNRSYINAVYLRGAQMLHQMRTTLGDEGFYAWLQNYVTHNQFHLVTPINLWTELSPEQYATSEPIRREFFENVNILPNGTGN